MLERFEEIGLDHDTHQKFLTIGPATIDRLSAPEGSRFKLKVRSKTKPGALLKHQIPIPTFSEWDNTIPGFVEIDLVSHDGGISGGDAIQTLDVTDISTAWTETRAVRNKSQHCIFEALADVITHLPFELKGIDSDDIGEFINNHVLRFCKEHHLTFSRSRPIRKNDNCYVELKNWSIVCKATGYYRYDTPDELELLSQLYCCACVSTRTSFNQS